MNFTNRMIGLKFTYHVENTSKGPQVFVSRSHPDLLKRLLNKKFQKFMMELLKSSVAREAGDRSKVAVRSTDPNIDPVGTCVGPKANVSKRL